MKILKRILLLLGILIVLITLAAYVFGRHIAHRAIPDYNADIVIPGLEGDVTVIRDAWAVPHIYADNEYDLYKTVGYLSAQDRMWQMDLLRRATQGRLSEMFGADLVDVDHRMRSLRITDKSEMILENCDPEILRIFEAYAEGVNKYLDDQGKALPPEFTILNYKPDRWEPIHSMNLIGYMSWDLSMAWSTEIILHKISKVVDSLRFAELIPDLSLQTPATFPDFTLDSVFEAASETVTEEMDQLAELGLQVFSGSNNWAVSPERTTNGKALFANDMHLGLFAPGLWTQMHQVVEGKLNVTGLNLPGQPFIIVGHNNDIAWGMTNVMIDDIDFYLETTDAEHPDQYFFNGEWHDMERVTETISISGGEQVERDILYTHRGPVITEFKNTGEDIISMHWVGNDKSNEILTVYKLNRAKNWEEYKEACKTFISIAQNINYADAEGNIGLHMAGGIPLRPGTRAFVSPGDTSAYDWAGFVPYSSLPQSYNPESGQVSSANTRTVDESYPYGISHWFDLPFRLIRIRDLLESKETLEIEDFIMIQGDQHSLFAKKLLPLLVSALDGSELSGNGMEKEALDKLKAWDLDFSADAAEPLIFEVLYMHILEEMFIDEMGAELFEEFLSQDLLALYTIDKIMAGQVSHWSDDINTPDVEETFGDIVVRAFPKAVNWISDTLGQDMNSWEWGRVHTLGLNHPIGSVAIMDWLFNLNRGPFPVGGSFHTVSPYSYKAEKSYEAVHGSSHRHIYVPGDWDKSLTVIPTGISGIPASKHYCDQTGMYLNMEYHPDPFSREAVETAKVYEMRFSPGEE